ncbi:MAG: NAD(P) transhydrogenase subunit alpha [Leptospiraceae bacterium]|nr:NAD(P) transhydrogenase subunit alpha [Leptospiraceae bacterium]
MEDFFAYFLAYKYFIYILLLTFFVGIEVVDKVPAIFHTPLMSSSNALHGVVIVGAILIMGQAKEDDTVSLVLGFIAVTLATINVVGGFILTERILKLFQNKSDK